uniref:Speedy protein n=1 Tax=Leptobrachium leishanense TaxID=445787 RepID=A0A8C5QIR0_9ANUR
SEGWVDAACYLLAMVLAYFRRARFDLSEYDDLNFFTALSLANNMEEEGPFHEEIYPWALGATWRKWLPQFKELQDMLWRRMGYQALVDKKMCSEIMAEDRTHLAWTRQRRIHHGFAKRLYLRTEEECSIRGPGRSPRECELCVTKPAPYHLRSSTSSRHCTGAERRAARKCVCNV